MTDDENGRDEFGQANRFTVYTRASYRVTLLLVVAIDIASNAEKVSY